jgi:hypothetical protein
VSPNDPDDFHAELIALVTQRALARHAAMPAFRDWLEREAGPDDWHDVAMRWNWDFGRDVLTWITRQKWCDRATALLLFWKSRPDYFVAFGGVRAAVPEVNRDGFDFVQELRSRWRAGDYVRAELHFDLAEELRPDFAELDGRFGERAAIELPLDMRGPLSGRVLEPTGMIEGIPARFWPEDLR